MGFLLSLFFGFVPMILFGMIIYGLDRYEKEPGRLLFGAFLWGVVVSGAGAFIINTSFEVGMLLLTDSATASSSTTSTVVAPIIEELLKGLAVLLVYIRKRNEFDSILDGIVYASFTALGFAALENTYYIYNFGYLENGLGGLIFLVFVRVILVGWQHPFYTSFIGIGLALHRTLRGGFWRNLAPVFGLTVAILSHSLHNTLSITAADGLSALTATAFDWVGWGFMAIFIWLMIRREKRFMISHLAEEVSFGVLTPEQYLTAINPARRWKARLAALGRNRWRQTNRFYQVCGEIALKKNQLLTLGDEQGNSRIIDQHRQELSALAPFAES